MERKQYSGRFALGAALLSSAMAAFGGYSLARSSVESPKQMPASNVLRYDSTYLTDIYTDMDFDGELDLREQRVIGAEGFTKLFYKKGFAPTQNPGCEVEHVEPSYFDNANKIFHQQLVDKAYGH